MSDGIFQLCDLSQHHVLIGQDVVQLLGDLVLGFKNNTQCKKKIGAFIEKVNNSDVLPSSF